ncbi:MAG TPA: OmpA family protein [Puia sp.]|nr:OmpA family protein [Puia sp.]
MQKLLYLLAIGLVLNGCVPKRKLHAAQADARALRADSARQAARIASQGANIDQLNSQIDDLNKRLTDLQNRSGLTEDQLNQSKEQIAEQRRRLAQLQALMDQQKNAIQDIRKKMSDALVGFNSKDLSVSIKNGKVYVSLSENLLFPSGSAVVNPKGKEALGKLATVLNTNPDITVDIEGHTDSVPIHGRYPDNWALSVARSTAIVRILTTDYLVDPVRVIASGHSSYDPVQPNGTPEGRALNRRTEIILSPKLDELYKLLESSPGESGGEPK